MYFLLPFFCAKIELYLLKLHIEYTLRHYFKQSGRRSDWLMTGVNDWTGVISTAAVLDSVLHHL